MQNKSYFFSYNFFRFENNLKNILIFFPFFISPKNLFVTDLFDLFFGFVIFSILTSICYATNNFTDRKKDKVNKLKKNLKTLNKKTIILINIFLYFLLAILFFYSEFFSYYLLIYLICFYLYNFLIKDIILLDIIFLVSFYLIRIYYGASIINIDITYWFLIFFSTLFFILSIFKRIIQIDVNNLVNKNLIISYTQKNLIFLKGLIFLFLILNIGTFSLYIYEIENPGFLSLFSSSISRYELNTITLTIFFAIYIFWIFRLIILVFTKKIKKDIYMFLITDKISYLCLTIVTAILILYKFL